VSNAFSSDGVLVLSWLLFLMAPGLALLLWLPSSLTLGQKLVGGPAVSVLTLPVFLLLTRALAIKLSTPAMWGIIVISALAVLVWLVKNRRSLTINRQTFAEDAAFWAMLAGLLFLTIAGRLLPLRDAQAGMGLDAYHHTLIGEMFIRAGGIPQNYAPYASLGSFTYHFGFHAMLAAVGWLSGLTSAVNMLPLMPQAGQVAISLPVLSLTLFGWRVLGDRWAGLAAGGLAGLVSILPAFYVNWSRYTQGLGLALLPVSWVLLLEALQWKAPPVDTTAARARWRDVTLQSGPLMLAVIGAAGLALSHYRIAMIYAAFVALYLLWVVVKRLREKQQLRMVLNPVLRTALVAALTLAAASPWLVNLAQNFGTRFVGKSGSQGVGEGYYSLQTMGIGPLLAHPSIPLLYVLALGAIVTMVKRLDPLPFLPTLTWSVLALWSNPYLLPVRLPYAGYLDSTTVATGIWLPLAIMAGFSLSRFAAWALGLGAAFRQPGSAVWRVGAGAALGVAALLGGAASAWLLAPDIDRKPYIAPADVQAMIWMRDNLPKSSSVLANPFAFPWDPEPKAIQGSDAGLWVPLVTDGIKSSVPPIPAYNERLSDPDYINKIREVINYEPFGDGQADWDALERMGITHVFVGSRGGALDVNVLLKSDRTQLVWHQDSVWVFELR
jgi:hypothetical protein